MTGGTTFMDKYINYTDSVSTCINLYRSKIAMKIYRIKNSYNYMDNDLVGSVHY